VEADGDATKPVVNDIAQAIKTFDHLDHAALKARWHARLQNN
jgi:hypothetical protein